MSFNSFWPIKSVYSFNSLARFYGLLVGLVLSSQPAFAKIIDLQKKRSEVATSCEEALYGGPRRLVLVVRTESSAAEEQLLALKEYDYDVIHATTGEDAERYAMLFDPTAILIDTDIPDKSAFEVVNSLRVSTRTLNLPILITSAQLEESSVVRAFASGATDVLDTSRGSRDVLVRLDVRIRLAQETRSLHARWIV